MKSANVEASKEIIQTLLEASKASTIRSIYERIEPWSDGRIRTQLTPTTETGRLASKGRKRKDWPGWEFSTNLQNLPKKAAKIDSLYEVRNCIIPAKGEVLIEADLSQAEARATCAYAHDYATLKLFDSGADIHKITAARVLGIPVEQVTPTQREVAGKFPRHALSYGMEWRKFLREVNDDADLTGITISAKEAQEIVDGYRRDNACLLFWWESVKDAVRRQGFLINAFGRKRIFIDTYDVNDQIAYLPQSTIADHLNDRLIAVFETLDGAILKVLHQIHDAILISAPYVGWRAAARALKQTMTKPIQIEDISLTIPVEISVSSKSWGQMKKVEV